MIMTVLPAGIAAAETPAETTFISEGGEQTTFEEWNVRWDKKDNNPESSLDTWCRTTHTAHSGSYSIYCAKSGYNTHYLNSTGVQPLNADILSNGGGGDPANLVMRYDTDMDAVMRKYVSGAMYYNNITMTFWFYSDTGISDATRPDTGEAVGYDFLSAFYLTGSNTSLTKHIVWTCTQEQALSKAWHQVTLTLPNTLTWVGFEFVSGDTPPEDGDPVEAFISYGVHNNPQFETAMKEGVYLDDITVVGSDPVTAVPLVTSVGELSPYQTTSSFPVPFVDNDPLRLTMDWVYLWYRVNGTGDWIKYTTAAKPFGAFVTSPIMFEATRDGTYEFFTQGKEISNWTETKRNAADATTIVDTVLPSTTIQLSGDLSGGQYKGAAAFTLTSTDALSGVNQTLYRIDGGAWSVYSRSVGIATTGTHTVEYYATDKAGNIEAIHEEVFAISSGQPGIVFQNTDTPFTGNNVTVGFTVVGEGSIVKLEYSLDGGSYIELDPNATSVTFSGLSEGDHTLAIKATNDADAVLTGETTFKVGTSSTDDLGSLLGNPLVLGGIAAAVVAAVVGGVWYMRRRK